MKQLQAKILLLVMLGLVGWSSSAFAAALSWSSDTTVTLNAHDYTILSGSGATTFTVGSTTLTVDVPAATTFTFVSPDKYVLNNDQGLTATCTTVNTLVITGPQTVVITPNAPTTCTASSGGGGGPAPTGIPITPTPSPSNGGGSNPHPTGSLVLDGSTVYLIVNGNRAGFRDEQEYLSYGFNFAQVVPIAITGDTDKPMGAVLKAMEGTLVLDKADGKTVYMIGLNGTKRGFASSAVFKALGYNFNNLFKINLTDYPVGPVIGESDLPHPEGALVLEGKTVWWILNGEKRGFQSEAVFKTYGFSFARVVPANAADKALPVGELVKFRDGTLVLDGGNYYIISSGKKVMFTSTSTMQTYGYKPANAISASLSAYESGGTL